MRGALTVNFASPSETPAPPKQKRLNPHRGGMVLFWWGRRFRVPKARARGLPPPKPQLVLVQQGFLVLVGQTFPPVQVEWK